MCIFACMCVCRTLHDDVMAVGLSCAAGTQPKLLSELVLLKKAIPVFHLQADSLSHIACTSVHPLGLNRDSAYDAPLLRAGKKT